MVILVCGSRDYQDLDKVIYTLDTFYRGGKIDKIIIGGCRGPDKMAHRWGISYDGTNTSVFHADWNRHGKAAGPIRNQQMLDEGKPDLVMAFWDGKSAGTKDMINRAIKAGVEVRIYPEANGKT